MCGIAGYVDYSGSAPAPELLRAMAASLHRRGPDEEGVKVVGCCGLAHRRLSIIDLEHSQQPMTPPGGGCTGVYNGELYNYRELRAELVKQGVSFATPGDTEVLIRALALRQEAALPDFDGMFAFAVWDHRRETLLLARDPLGVKPLYYATPRPGLFVFASEIKALLQHPEVHADLDLGGLRQTLRFRAVYGAGCLYQNVFQIQPGEFLELSREGIRQDSYHDLSRQVEIARDKYRGWSADKLVDHGRSLLSDAVKKRLIADVPVGALLSGGIDSSLIASLMQQHRTPQQDTQTFTVGFRGDPHSELSHARMVATVLGTKHTEVLLSEEDYRNSFTDLTRCRDAPLSEPADIAIAKVSIKARESVKVVLSGEGCDEVFCGYPKYRFAAASGWLSPLLRRFGERRTLKLATWAGLNLRRTRIAVQSLGQRVEIERLAQWFSCFDRTALQSLLPGLGWSDEDWVDTLSAQKAVGRKFHESGALGRMQAVDCLTWLPGNLLERGDRMTMATGLEMRVPFLDPRLVHYGLSLPARFKVRDNQLKWIVRKWSADLLPPSIIKRRKWGFRVPLQEWFRAGLRDMLFDYLRCEKGLCAKYGDRRLLDKLLHDHQSGALDAGLELWTLLATEVWYQDVFSARDAPFPNFSESECTARPILIET